MLAGAKAQGRGDEGMSFVDNKAVLERMRQEEGEGGARGSERRRFVDKVLERRL